MLTPPLRLAINGAAGRMGLRVIALAQAMLDVRLTLAVDRATTACSGATHDQTFSHDGFDVAIDFSSAEGTAAALDACTRFGKPLVIGTTGLSDALLSHVGRAAEQIPVLRSANMSVGVNVLLRIAGDLCAALGNEYDIEIIEQHHRFKADAPSGTALALLDAVRRARSGAVDDTVVNGRVGVSPRAGGEIGMHAVRLGDTVGEHSVLFGGLGETITLHHSAHTRDVFAAGALRAARWIVGKPIGLYSMQDVLFDGVNRPDSVP